MSLARAFFGAGASAVVGTLDCARDDEAGVFFSSMYRAMSRGVSVGEAVTAAKREGIPPRRASGGLGGRRAARRRGRTASGTGDRGARAAGGRRDGPRAGGHQCGAPEASESTVGAESADVRREPRCAGRASALASGPRCTALPALRGRGEAIGAAASARARTAPGRAPGGGWWPPRTRSPGSLAAGTGEGKAAGRALMERRGRGVASTGQGGPRGGGSDATSPCSPPELNSRGDGLKARACPSTFSSSGPPTPAPSSTWWTGGCAPGRDELHQHRGGRARSRRWPPS